MHEFSLIDLGRVNNKDAKTQRRQVCKEALTLTGFRHELHESPLIDLKQPPEICPQCGSEVPPEAVACPECGSDYETGWSEEADAQRLGLPDEKFDYDEFVKEEFHEKGAQPRNRGAWWWIAAILLLIALVLFFLRPN